MPLFSSQFNKVDKALSAVMPFMTVTGVLLGLLLGDSVRNFTFLVSPFFAVLTFSNSLGVTVDDFMKVIRKPKSILIFLILAYFVIPFFMHFLSVLVFSSSSPVTLGFVLLYSIPTAVVSVVWSSLNGGNRALSLTLLIIATFLSPISTPLTIRVLAGSSVEFDVRGIVMSLLFMILIPSFLSIFLGKVSDNKIPELLSPYLRPISKILLVMIVALNISQVSDEFINSLGVEYLKMALSVATFTVLAFTFSFFVSHALHLENENAVSVAFASSLRNISATLVLAINYFPPAVSIPVIFGIVMQQVTCAFTARIILKHVR